MGGFFISLKTYFRKKALLKYFFSLLLLAVGVSSTAQTPRLMLPLGHTDELSDAIFTTDGKRVITTSLDGMAKVWNAEGRLLLNLKGGHETGPIATVACSLDGSVIATETTEDFTNERVVKVWDGLTGRQLGYYRAGSVRVSPDGRKVVLSGGKGTRVIDARSGSLLQHLPGTRGFQSFIDIDSMGENLLLAEDLRGGSRVHSIDTIWLWSLRTGELLRRFTIEKESVTALRFSSDGQQVLCGSESNILRVWDVARGNLLTQIATTDAPDFVGGDGHMVVAAPLEHTGQLRCWTVADGRIVYSLPLSKPAWVVRMDASGKYIALATADSLKAYLTATGNSIFAVDGTASALAWNKGSLLLADSIVYDVTAGRRVASLRGGSLHPLRFGYLGNGDNLLLGQGKDNILWRIGNGVQLTGVAPGEKLLGSSPSFFTTLSTAGSINTWDLRSGTRLHSIPVGKSSVLAGVDAKRLVLGDSAALQLTDLSGNTLHRIKVQGKVLLKAANKDFTRLLVFTTNNHIALINLVTGIRLLDLNLDQSATRILLSNDGNFFVACLEDKTARLYQADGKIIGTYAAQQTIAYGYEFEDKGSFSSIAFSPDSKKLLTVTRNGVFVELRECTTGKELRTLPIDKGFGFSSIILFARFSPDGKTILVTFRDYKALLLDADDGHILGELVGHQAEIIGADFSSDSKRLLTISADNTARVWSAMDGKNIFHCFATDTVNFFVQRADGYYWSSKTASRGLHYVTSNLDVVSFEQLDLRYNRPDKVLELFASTSKEVVESYRKAYEKRIRKLGIDTLLFADSRSVPLAAVVNRMEIPYVANSSSLPMHLVAKDSIHALQRVQIWLNGSPQLGPTGIKLRGTRSFDSTFLLTLTDGNNVLEASVTNSNGVESYRSPIEVMYMPPQPSVSRLYFVGIGIDSFAQSEHNLGYSVKDVRDLAAAFREKYGSAMQVDTLFNERVTPGNVLALKEKLRAASVNDRVIVAYSGHGLLSRAHDYYLSAHGTRFEQPENGSIPYEHLESLMEGISPVKKLLLIDACHSGEVDKEEAQKLHQATGALSAVGTRVAGAKGIAPGRTTSA
ncbi:MAG: hypothetical protein EOP49_11595, partial [Sphingobacteriales bacterium]